jgi:hypothetical protein
VLLLNECLLLLLISLSTQSGNFWIHPRTEAVFRVIKCFKGYEYEYILILKMQSIDRISCTDLPDTIIPHHSTSESDVKLWNDLSM